MSNVKNDGKDGIWIDDDDSIGGPAKNDQERKDALKYCLTEVWPNTDIGRLERTDSEGVHGWEKWDWQSSKS